MVLEGWGEEGQLRLKNSKVLVVGAGGLGASILSYLACAGLGHIGIIDHDRVELSNLNRQIIHETGDIGSPKVLSAKERISELNPSVQVTTYSTRINNDNAEELIAPYDIIMDAVDNFDSRFVINAACFQLKKSWIYCAIRGAEGQLSCFDAGNIDAPCYQCFVPSAPHHHNDCAQRGAIGAVLGVMGSMAAMEAIKILLQIGQPAFGSLVRYDALLCQFTRSTLMKDPECGFCSNSKNKAC